MMDWLDPLPFGPADIDITDSTTGVPVWVLLVAIVISAAGGALTSWVTHRRDRATSEQALIDQLQEEVRSLRTDLTATQTEVRTMRLRDIAWITYTSDLTRVALEAGANPPPMPTELRMAPNAAPATS